MKVKQATSYALHAMMYMVRHVTQLPVTTGTIAKAEGISPGYLSKIFHQLAKADLVKATSERKKGYLFAKPAEDISLLELFEAVEGGPLFNECFMSHCQCGGTPQNCRIYATWRNAMKKVADYLAETSLVTAAWNHPDHRFNELPAVKPLSKNEPRIGEHKTPVA